MCRLLLLLLVCAALGAAQGMTYVVLWFDTEDYVDPVADDAALRIANDLTRWGSVELSKSSAKRRGYWRRAIAVT